MASFKIYFSEDNIRRFRSSSRPTFEAFVNMLSTHYPTSFHPELRIQYVDSEGDRIDVNSELEWNEMFEQLTNEPVIKIHIVEGAKGKYFKDGPPAEPLFFHDPKKNERVSPPSQNLSLNVPLCLQQFFPSGRILPFNIPAFLQNIITTQYISSDGDAVVDIDVDLPRLATAIHRKAMSHLEVKEYSEALHAFKSQCILEPENPIPFYNVACAASLLKNEEEALKYLNQAIDLGYKNLEHMLQDSDLDNIRHCEGFVLACRRLRPEPEPVVVPPVPVYVPEPVVVSPVVPEPVPEPVVVPPVVPVPVPVPEPVVVAPVVPEPVVPPVYTRWAAELEVLHDIGYVNDELIVPILEKNNGNVQQTVLELLDM